MRTTLWKGLILGICVAGSLISLSSAETPYKTLELSIYPPHTEPPPLVGQTVTGSSISLAALKGKAVLLTFWASWCAECLTEMPLFEQLHREFASQGLVILGINVREEKETIQRYAKDFGLTFPLVLDPDGQVTQSYGVIGLPTTILINRDGKTGALAVGSRDWGSAPARTIIQGLLTTSVKQDKK